MNIQAALCPAHATSRRVGQPKPPPQRTYLNLVLDRQPRRLGKPAQDGGGGAARPQLVQALRGRHDHAAQLLGLGVLQRVDGGEDLRYSKEGHNSQSGYVCACEAATSRQPSCLALRFSRKMTAARTCSTAERGNTVSGVCVRRSSRHVHAAQQRDNNCIEHILTLNLLASLAEETALHVPNQGTNPQALHVPHQGTNPQARENMFHSASPWACRS